MTKTATQTKMHEAARTCCFPVELRDIKVPGASESDGNFKAIVRTDVNRVINVVDADTYKFVTNESAVRALLESIEKTGMRVDVDERHTFAEDHRMNLSVRFPDVSFKDGRSKIIMSANLRNSYDQSEQTGLIGGLYRLICENGATAPLLLGKWSHRHTDGLNVDAMAEWFVGMRDNLPRTEEFVADMQSKKFTRDDADALFAALGAKFGQKVLHALPRERGSEERREYGRKFENRWAEFNGATQWVSHDATPAQRPRLQEQIAKVFGF
jgi:hypothetical protein